MRRKARPALAALIAALTATIGLTYRHGLRPHYALHRPVTLAPSMEELT